MSSKKAIMDGNEAAAYISYAFTEVAGIFPRSPLHPQWRNMWMEWAANGKKELVWSAGRSSGNAVGRGRCGYRSRSAAGGCSDDHLYGFAGTASDDSEYV